MPLKLETYDDVYHTETFNWLSQFMKDRHAIEIVLRLAEYADLEGIENDIQLLNERKW